MTTVDLSIDEITVADNIRDHLTGIDDLADAIRSVGILTPLLVEDHPDNGYVLVAGHRRLSAAVKAGVTVVPCRLLPGPIDPIDRLSIMLVENIQRENLTPLEEARAFGQLRDNDLTQREIAARVGRTQPHVSRRLALLDLTQVDQDRLAAGDLTVEQALDRARGSTPPPPAPRPPRPRATPEHRQPRPSALDEDQDVDYVVPQLVVTLTDREHTGFIAASKRINVRPEALARRLIQQYLKATAG